MAIALVGFRTGYFGWEWIVAAAGGLLLGLAIAHLVDLVPTAGCRHPGRGRWRPTSSSAARWRSAGDLIAGVIPSGQTFRDLAPHAGPRLEAAADPAAPGRRHRPAAGAAAHRRPGRRGRHLHRRPPVDQPVCRAAGAAGAARPGRSRWARWSRPDCSCRASLFGLLAIGWMVLRAARNRAPLQNGAGRGARAGLAAGLLAVAAVAGLCRRAAPAGRGRRRPRGRPVRRHAAVRRRAVPEPAGGLPPLHRAQPRRRCGTGTCSGSRACRRVRRAVRDPRRLRRRRLGRGRPGQQRHPGRCRLPAGGLARRHPRRGPPRSQVRVTVPEGGYRDVWLPTVGAVTGIEFDGSRADQLASRLWLNVDTNTAIVPDRLAAGDRYTMEARLPDVPRRAARSRCPSTAGRLTPDVELGFLDAKVDAWTGEAEDPWGKLRAVARAMRSDGAYTDGGAPNSFEKRYLPGHAGAGSPGSSAPPSSPATTSSTPRPWRWSANRLGHPDPRRHGGRSRPRAVSSGAGTCTPGSRCGTPPGPGSRCSPRTFVPDRNKQPNQLQTKSERAEGRRPGAAAGRRQPAERAPGPGPGAERHQHQEAAEEAVRPGVVAVVAALPAASTSCCRSWRCSRSTARSGG